MQAAETLLDLGQGDAALDALLLLGDATPFPVTNLAFDLVGAAACAGDGGLGLGCLVQRLLPGGVQPVDVLVEIADLALVEVHLLAESLAALLMLADPPAHVVGLFAEHLDRLAGLLDLAVQPSGGLPQVFEVLIEFDESGIDLAQPIAQLAAARSCATGCRPRRGACRR